MLSPTLDELKDPARFQLLTALGHHEVAQFAAEYYWRRKTWVTWAHYLFSLVVAVVWVCAGLVEQLTFTAWLDQFGIAVLVALLLLLPVHELIHGAVYRFSGAEDVRYKVAWRQFYAYAIAHNFVAGRRVFTLVALAPFVIISVALMVGALVFHAHQFFLLAVLLIHTAGTSGDFAMLNYLWLRRDEEIFTFDDAEEKRSYFYQRIRPAT